MYVKTGHDTPHIQQPACRDLLCRDTVNASVRFTLREVVLAAEQAMCSLLPSSQTAAALSFRHAELRVQHCLYQALFESEGVSLAECCCCSQDSVWCGLFLLSTQ